MLYVCMQVLLNPPRAVLQARLGARAAAGGHFMPVSLLDSQLQQLDVQDPSELYMCFGCPQGTEMQPETTASRAHFDAAQVASRDGNACTEGSRPAASQINQINAAASVVNETGASFPSTEQIVAAIVAREGGLVRPV